MEPFPDQACLGLWLPHTHSSRPRLPMKISCLQVLHGLFMKAAELSPWELIGCRVFSILMTYPDGAQGRDPPGSRVAVGPAFPFAEHLVCGFFPDGPGVIFT